MESGKADGGIWRAARTTYSYVSWGGLGSCVFGGWWLMVGGCGIWHAGHTIYFYIRTIVALHNLASRGRRDIFSGRPFELSTYTLSRGYRTVRYLLRVDQMQMCDVTM